MVNFYQVTIPNNNRNQIEKILNLCNGKNGEIALIFTYMYQFSFILENSEYKKFQKNYEIIIGEKIYAYKQLSEMLKDMGVALYQVKKRDCYLFDKSIDFSDNIYEFISNNIKRQRDLINSYVCLIKLIKDENKALKNIIRLAIKHKKLFECMINKKQVY